MENKEQGIYINGRQQIIEMLQFMDNDEKQKLLGNIKIRNAVMARELSEQSLSFKDLLRLPTNHIQTIFQKHNPAIIGLALFELPITLQRKALQSLSRDIAEKAYAIMSSDLTNKKIECKRAQNKIVQTAIHLSRTKSVDL